MSIIIIWHNLHLSLYSSVVTTRRFLYRYTEHSGYHAMSRRMQAVCIALAERDGTRAETGFRLSPKRTSPFKSVGGVSSVDCW